MSGHITIEAVGDTALVRIDRPPANAMDVGLLEEGQAVLAELAAGEPRAVVMAGRPNVFSAGADLKVAPTLDAEGQRAMVAGINGIFGAWATFERPVVMAVTGHAIAGGMILALCGDHRVVSAEGRHGLTEVRAGIPYPAVAMAVVRSELSPPAARRLALGAALVDSPRALELGAYDELVAPGEVVSRALEVASELGALPAGAYAETKRGLRAGVHAAVEQVRAHGDPAGEGWIGADGGAAARALLGGR